MTRVACRAIGASLASILLLAACNSGTGLFSEGEREGLYVVTIRTETTTIEEAGRLAGGASLRLGCVETGGARAPAAIEVFVEDAELKLRPLARYSLGEASKSVAEDGVPEHRALQFRENLPPFRLPDPLADGRYSLVVRVLDTARVPLAEKRIPFYVLGTGWVARGVRTHPARVSAGERVLLSFDLDHPESSDPWIRWIHAGAIFSEGPASEGYARVVYGSPGARGAFEIVAEAFPSRPAVDERGNAPLSATAKLMVSAESGRLDPFGDDLFTVLYRCDGDWADSGTQAASASTQAPPRPSFATFDGGFGQIVDRDRIVRRSGPLMPSTGALVELRIVPSESDGRIVSFKSPTGDYLALLSDSSGLVVRAIRRDALFESSFRSRLVRDVLVTVAMEIESSREATTIGLWIDGRPAGRVVVPFPLDPASWNNLSFGGEGSARFVLDRFALAPADALPSPFAMSLARRWRDGVEVAADFSSDPLSRPLVSAEPDGARLARGAIVRVASFDALDGAIVMTDGVFPARAVPVLSFVAGESRVAALRSDGALMAADGSVLGRLDDTSALAIFVRAEKGRLAFYGVRDPGGMAQLVPLGSVPGEGPVSIDLINPMAESLLFRSFAVVRPGLDAVLFPSSTPLSAILLSDPRA